MDITRITNQFPPRAARPVYGDADVATTDFFPVESAQERHYERLESIISDLTEFFGAEAGDLVSIMMNVNVMDLLMAQRAVQALLPGWRVVKECRYSHNMPALVCRHAVEIAPDQHDFVIDYGRQYLAGPEGGKLAIDFYVDEDKRSQDSQLTFLVPVSEHDWVRRLVPKIRKWADENHFLRRQAFTAVGDYLRLNSPMGWSDVILPDNVRGTLDAQCISLLKHAPLYKANGVPLRRGIILHGKPGTGKTTIGRALANECGVTFILTTPGMLENPADVRRVFKWGRRFAPSILFFEDFDLVAGSRYRESRREILGEFLSCLDGVEAADGLIVIATTNDLQAIEPAIKDRPNRFDCIVEIPAFTKVECRTFLQKWTEQRSSALDVEKLAARAAGLTGAQLQELCRLSVLDAVNAVVLAGDSADCAVRIEMKHFDTAFAKMRLTGKRKVGFVTGE